MSWECRHVDRACITTTRWKPAEIRPPRGVRRPSTGCGRGTMRNSHSGIAREEPPPITNLTLAHDFDTCGSVVGAPVSFSLSDRLQNAHICDVVCVVARYA